MIIACPACATRYVVPDSAIGPEGRTVRCAKCKHSWFQDGPELAEPIAAAYAPASGDAAVGRAAGAGPSPSPAPSATPQSSLPAASPTPRPAERRESPAVAEATPVPSGPARARGDGDDDDDRRAVPAVPPAWVEDDEEVDKHGAQSPLEGPIVPPEPAFAAAGNGQPTPPAPSPVRDEDDLSPFDHGPPFRPRRNWLRWLTWGAGVFAALALAGVVAMATLGTPSWFPGERPMFGTDPGLTVEFPASEQERRQLPNGAEFFGARVVVTNETREIKRVPPLLIVLRDARERVVYSWELVPPQRTLAPGEAMTINEAMTDVPKSAAYAEIGWAPR